MHHSPKLYLLTLIAVLLVACDSTATATPISTVASTAIAVASQLPTLTPTLRPSITPFPTITPTPTNTPTLTVTPTPSITPTPTITPTPLPAHLVIASISVPIGGKSCGNLRSYENSLFDSLARAAKGYFLGEFYYVAEYHYGNLPRGVELYDASLALEPDQCLSASEDTPPGHYAIPLSVKIYETQGPGSETRTFLTESENTFFLYLRVLPPVSRKTGLLAFVSNRAGDYDLYVTNADGSELTRLTDGLEVSLEKWAWSPDGTRIAFNSSNGLFVVNADGTGLVKLLDIVSSGMQSLWSPDGQRIALGDYSSYILNADGSGQVELPLQASDIAWSPDGVRLVFTSRQGGSSDLFMTDAYGVNLTPLIQSPEDEVAPAWSPDGTQIAFIAKTGDKGELHVIRADGTRPVKVASDAAEYPTPPLWSPDGTRLAFISQRDGNDEIYIVNADGSELKQLARFDPFHGILDFAWASDGQRIALHAGFDLYVVNTDNSALSRLVESVEVRSLFSADGQRFAYEDSDQVYLVNLDGSGSLNLTQDDLSFNYPPVWQPAPDRPLPPTPAPPTPIPTPTP